ncbi:hypothetical protein SIN8267_03577 [Sinobacterium norvegicum]|uniref:YchJ-like middle NTF2-like domain-containing protein n=1 Tax=Sinobacterium norvegicum TaxID=1641715 RepID=A0ABN8EQZ3_9GAMM|nr:YchJ family protein [Sinobacterium norvegicum]CAH0993428.1 hypothetical protein SIN8267_03577 [Sinobacterium norvegicum]
MHKRTLQAGRCYCGLPTDYSLCCGPLHRGAAHAETAEQLMRSRYSACCLDLVDYLIDTTHASTKASYQPQELADWLQQSQWCSLQIVSSSNGGGHSDHVDFVAYHQEDKQLLQHREYSLFKRDADQHWYFVGGEHRNDIAIERNQSCPCGSGKKHKKCCL